ELRVFRGNDVRGARCPINDGQLAEMRAWSQQAEDHLAAILTNEDDLHPPVPDDEERVARIILEENDAAPGVRPLARQLGKARDFRGIQSTQQWNRGE